MPIFVITFVFHQKKKRISCILDYDIRMTLDKNVHICVDVWLVADGDVVEHCPWKPQDGDRLSDASPAAWVARRDVRWRAEQLGAAVVYRPDRHDTACRHRASSRTSQLLHRPSAAQWTSHEIAVHHHITVLSLHACFAFCVVVFWQECESMFCAEL